MYTIYILVCASMQGFTTLRYGEVMNVIICVTVRNYGIAMAEKKADQQYQFLTTKTTNSDEIILTINVSIKFFFI